MSWLDAVKYQTKYVRFQYEINIVVFSFLIQIFAKRKLAKAIINTTNTTLQQNIVTVTQYCFDK